MFLGGTRHFFRRVPFVGNRLLRDRPTSSSRHRWPRYAARRRHFSAPDPSFRPARKRLSDEPPSPAAACAESAPTRSQTRQPLRPRHVGVCSDWRYHRRAATTSSPPASTAVALTALSPHRPPANLASATTGGHCRRADAPDKSCHRRRGTAQAYNDGDRRRAAPLGDPACHGQIISPAWAAVRPGARYHCVLLTTRASRRGAGLAHPAQWRPDGSRHDDPGINVNTDDPSWKKRRGTPTAHRGLSGGVID